ncbi:hypothetical protein ACEWY4_022705 [Coilia grayii]|uniref:Uncharacterized protein n=1 Tax=Coilia grayii TaxID=363190 RepID=A0ABD1J0X6_9TELE
MKTSLAGGSQSPLWIYFSLLICAPLSHGSVSSGTHEIQYTVRPGPNNKPQFQQTTLFNGQVIFTCSSPALLDQPRQQWVTHTFTQEQLQQRHKQCRGQYEEHLSWHEKIKETMSGTLDVLQRRRGCITNSSGVSAFDEWGVNGEDFLTFDPQTLKWTALSDRAIALASEWNNLDIRNYVYRNFGQNVCPETYHTLRISKAAWINNTGQTETELHIFVKPIPENAFSCIRCHVTGSDLSGVRIQLTKDGVPLNSGVKLIGPRPNGDGTNQMRVCVELRLKDTERYECQVQRGTENKHVQLEALLLDKEPPPSRERPSSEDLKKVLIGTMVCLGVVLYIAFLSRKYLAERLCQTRGAVVSLVEKELKKYLHYVQTQEQFDEWRRTDDEFYPKQTGFISGFLSLHRAAAPKETESTLTQSQL